MSVNVVAKIISRKTFSRNVVRSVLSKAWNLNTFWSIGSTMQFEQNIFSFVFEHEVNKKQIMDRQPWSINGDHMVIRNVDLTCIQHETDLSKSVFWVQLHDVPFEFLTHQNAVKVGEIFSKTLEINLQSVGNLRWHCFLWIVLRLLSLSHYLSVFSFQLKAPSLGISKI